MKATTLTCSTFEMMYYKTRGVYCNPAEKFLSYTEFKRMFEPVMFGNSAADEAATTIYNKAINNGATEEAALHAALFVFKFTAGKQAARKWFDELVAKQFENDNSDDSNGSEVEEELKLFGRDLEIYLNTYAMFDATKNGAFMPIINEYRINCIDRARQLKKKRTSKENTELVDAVIAALEDAESGAKALLKLCECFIEDTFDMTNEEQRTKVLEILKDYLPKPKPEEDPKDPDPTGPSDSGAVISEPVEEPIEEIFETVEAVETPMVANNITIEERFRALKSCMDDLWTTDPHHPEVVFKASYIMTKMCSIAEEIEHKSAADTTVMEHYIWKYICKLSDIVNDINASGDFSNFHRVLPASYTNFMEAKNKDQAIYNMATIRCNNTPDPASAQGRIELPTDVLNRTMSESKSSKKRSSKPKVPEAVEVNGKYLTDQDLLKVFQDKVTIYKYQGMHRHHVNMLLNYIMNDADGVVTKLVQELKAKTPIKLIQVDFDKYTADVNRFDIVFEIESSTEGKPIVMFYNMEPVFDEEHNKWRNEMCIKPFDECTLTVNKPVKAQTEQKTEKKDSKKSSKPRSKTKKKEEQQPAPQPQAMTATA